MQIRLKNGTYDGEVNEYDVSHGKGKFTFDSGNIYRGEFVCGVMCGKKMTYAHKSLF